MKASVEAKIATEATVRVQPTEMSEKPSRIIFGEPTAKLVAEEERASNEGGSFNWMQCAS